MFVNILTPAHKCFLLNRDNLKQPTHVILFQKQKAFSEFFSAILKSRLNFKHFQKKYDSHSWCICDITDSQKCGYINL